MFHNLAQLIRYRGLIQSLVARELKARYRGSALGFFWSFINPLLLLLVYSFVFEVVMPGRAAEKPYSLFLFCGLLPWTWFSSSVLESAGVLISGGNLIKKVLFPAEVLPIVTVLSNMVHFLLGLPVLVAFLVYYRRPLEFPEVFWFPVIVLTQLILTMGIALIVSALTVHFRDIKDILGNLMTFWFFATPIIYPFTGIEKGSTARTLLNLNPVTHLAVLVPGADVLSRRPAGAVRPRALAAGAARGVGRRLPGRLFPVRPAARLVRGRSLMVAIEASGVTKVYRRFTGRRQFATLKSALLRGTVLRDLHPAGTFAAVRNVSFTVPQGATYGIIGRNGSGKSTMLKLVAGITKPTEGTVTVNGRLSALIELGAGFHPEISGRENVFINGIMLGLSKREITRRFDEIVEFAELRDFIDAPVKTYSSGMYVRLGFAVAINVDPDVLLVDEVLAVGDEAFTHKCLDKFAEFRRRGKTILLVTHSLNLVERFCDDVLWLDGGTARGEGDPRRVVSEYIADVAKGEEKTLAAADAQ